MRTAASRWWPPARPPVRLSRVYALLVALAASLSAAPAPSDPALERERVAIANEMVALGAAVQREIERADAAALLARVPAAGLRCGARLVPRARVQRDLRNPRSWLHGMLFGGPGFTPITGGSTSLRAFFADAKEVAVLVGFRRDTRAGAVGRPCLEYRAPNLPAPAFPLCFERRGGAWWFADSLYPCG
jgi:hypothetical protein